LEQLMKMFAFVAIFYIPVMAIYKSNH
jgi:hypothetical protein